MLITIRRFEDFNFPALMALYREGNEENGAIFYPLEPLQTQLALAEQAFRTYLANDFFSKENVRYCIWHEGETYLSALRLEPFRDGLLLEALETHPDHRRKGYAKQLIRSVFSQLPTGTRIYSYVDKENVPSLAAHFACGFSILLDHAVQPDGEFCIHEYTLSVTT